MFSLLKILLKNIFCGICVARVSNINNGSMQFIYHVFTFHVFVYYCQALVQVPNPLSQQAANPDPKVRPSLILFKFEMLSLHVVTSAVTDRLTWKNKIFIFSK